MIVGAGVVGCYLGKKLGDETIYELRSASWEKTCGGLFSRNIKKLDVSLDESLENEVKGARFFSNSEAFEIKTKRTQAYVVDRFKFQKSLLKDAVDNNCKIKYGKKWSNEKDDYVIGADGAYSEVARSCGIKRSYFNCYQVECELSKRKDEEFVELHFGDFAPGFFGWMIPINGRCVRIGLGCTRGNPAEHFKSFSRKFEIKKVNKVQAAMIPIYDGKKTVFNNVALVGDAAGQVKASSGGGVVIGLGCAEVLAGAIKRDDLNSYETEWRKKYGGMLKDHLLVRRFLNRVNYDKLLRAAEEKEMKKVIEQYGDMEDTTALKRHFMKNPLTALSFSGALF